MNVKKYIFIGVGMTIMSSRLSSHTFAKDWDLPGVNLITRAQRGADESIRYTTSSYKDRIEQSKQKDETELLRLEDSDIDSYIQKQKQQYIKEMRNEYLQWKAPLDQYLDTVVYQKGNKYFKRPESYHYQKTKILIHHTAGDTSNFTGEQSAIDELKEIYKFHTLKRGRGDIGYHFIIDPYGNIYEGRAGGEGVVAAHASWNNIPSIGIALMGNFDLQKPTEQQMAALVNLITVLSKKYKIDPYTTTDYHREIADEPYLQTTEHATIAGHKDAGNTSCPGKNLYTLLPSIKKIVAQQLQEGILVSLTKTASLPSVLLPSSSSGTGIIKIKGKVTLDQAKQYMQKEISVLLYDLSVNYTTRLVSCDGGCLIQGETSTNISTGVGMEIAEGGILITTTNGEKQISKEVQISAKADHGLVRFLNYPRVSYKKIPWNVFYGKITISRGVIKDKKTGKFEEQYTVVNTLPILDYLKGIAETNDTEALEKIKVMSLLAKDYVLFYMHPDNKHPSIPNNANYKAIDDPDMFQKYVGAGYEKTSKKVPLVAQQLKDTFILYKGIIPILPYFSCSSGFTYSAKEKWGRSDTPYLQRVADVEKCSTFLGHGVGLSGKGAQALAKKGKLAKQIVQYYYSGVDVK